MKTSRIVLVVSLAHFALWWMSQAVIHFSHFTPYTNVAYHSSAYGHAAFVLQTMLTFPFQMTSMYPEGGHLQTYSFVALDSCIWGLVLGCLIYVARHNFHKRAA